MNRCLTPTDQMIKNIIEIELGYINTNHPDFIGGTNLMISMSKNEDEEQSHADKRPALYGEEKKVDKFEDKSKEKRKSLNSQQIRE